MSIFQRFFMTTLTFLALAVVFPTHVFVRDVKTALLASFILAVLNMLVKPVLVLFSLPLTIITFGFFSFVINGLMLVLTSKIIGSYNFDFSSLWWAVISAMVMSFINTVITEHNLSKIE